MHGFFAAQSRRRILMMLALGTACASAPAMARAAEPLRVVATFSVLGDMVHEIGGPDVAVTTLVGPDGDAHEYEPTPQAARQLAGAAVLIENGLGFETWLPRLVKAAGFAGCAVVASQGIAPRKLADAEHDHDGGDGHGAGHEHGHGDADGHAHGHETGHRHHHGDLDPHAWQSLANGAVYARNIGAGLAAADPERAEAYRERAQAYIARIEALDARIRATFAAIPAARRQVVTSHDAFGYFGDAYGVRFIAVAGFSTDAEPSAADMARIVEQVKRERVPAVFVENITSPALVRQIARETGASVGGTLYSDALAPSGKPAATYLGMFEWNARQLSAALRPQ